MIGVTDVKSQPVYFYVQRKTNFTTWNTPMPFEIEKMNVGGGMNLKTGVFTAPKSDEYFSVSRLIQSMETPTPDST